MLQRALAFVVLIGVPTGAAIAQDPPLRVTTVSEGVDGPRYTINKPAYVAIVEATTRDVRVVWPFASGEQSQLVVGGSRPIPTRGVTMNSSNGVSTGSGGVNVSAGVPGGISRPLPRGWIVVASTEPLAFKSPAEAEDKIRNAIAKVEKTREVALDERLSIALSAIGTVAAAETASDRLYSDPARGQTVGRTAPITGDPCDPKKKPKDRTAQAWLRMQCGDIPSTEVPKPTPLPTTKVPSA
jgi:hypothetical protein